MPSVQWVYANGCNWIVLDSIAQSQIECLWAQNGSSWIQSRSFTSPIYVDISQMVLMCDGTAYSIARRRT